MPGDEYADLWTAVRAIKGSSLQHWMKKTPGVYPGETDASEVIRSLEVAVNDSLNGNILVTVSFIARRHTDSAVYVFRLKQAAQRVRVVAEAC